MVCRPRLATTPLMRGLQRVLALGRPHLRLLGQAFACMLVVGATTGVYAWLMGPVLQFLLSGGTRGLGPVLRWAPGVASWPREQLLWALPVVVVVVGLVKGLGYLGQFYWVGLWGQHVVVDLRRTLFERFLALSPSQRAAQLSGDLMSRFTADVAVVEQAATYAVASWLRDTVQIAILVVVAFSVSWQLSLLALLAVPIAVLPASRLTRALLNRTREGQAALGGLAGQVQEGLGALRTIQAFEGQVAELERFDRTTAVLRRALTRAGWAKAAVPGVMEVLASMAIAGALAWALGQPDISPEALVSFLGAVILLYQPAKDLGRLSQFAVAAAAALERIDAVLQLPARIAFGAASAPADWRQLRFQDVRFAWGDREVLRGVSFTAQRGQLTAIVGASGAGKSSLVTALLRFEPLAGGRIALDDVDAAALSADALRSQFALVTQDALLFAGSVADNLRVGRPDATAAQLEQAACVAQAHDFITALPQGYQTPVGERGVTLSGGQKQRLCLARAVVSGAPVLVLDEATSSLDPAGEREVQAALDAVLQGHTALVIAHRLSTIRGAQHIVVLADGRVVEEGIHDALIARGGAYTQLWALQTS